MENFVFLAERFEVVSGIEKLRSVLVLADVLDYFLNVSLIKVNDLFLCAAFSPVRMTSRFGVGA